MEYIRTWKSSVDYVPNTTHCMYGLDAGQQGSSQNNPLDLIMLSLTTHEPHTALLREEVLTKQAKNTQAGLTNSFLYYSM